MEDILDILTEEEFQKLDKTHKCPLCGKQFMAYPTGWNWEIHIRNCLKTAGRA